MVGPFKRSRVLPAMTDLPVLDPNDDVSLFEHARLFAVLTRQQHE